METMMRSRPYLVGERTSYIYYPDCAEVGIGAGAEIRGRSFALVAEVTVDTTGAEGVLFKQGGAHGGHVLFIADGRLHYVYNFLGERQQLLSSVRPIPLGHHLFGCAMRGRARWPTAIRRWATLRCTSTTTRWARLQM
ncbi:arylsulfatase domain protein [Mycobacterium ulcerans str. Harvey]|uniref:Arylsulfatase domain protein n=1 Tax=Mycobacterium ulcerans str. Harvey TaxID=1299332 RepID=A0ABN0R5B5_MYCUL|nr:arylsulfatase domain protein [Mycobacterium ulcerans str. Harvey]